MTTFGIDLGTTNSAIARMRVDGTTQVVPNAITGHLTTPSVVYLESASTAVVGEVAVNAAAVESELVVKHIKREMGKVWERRFHGQRHTPESISALILRSLKADAESLTGESVKRAVITVPAYFGSVHRQATIEAGVLAGLEVPTVLSEPTAAAIAYGFRPDLTAQPDQTLLVYDLGGGTIDVSLLQTKGAHVDEVIVDGHRRLGGADWDRALVEWLIEQFEQQVGAGAFPAGDPAAMFQLRQQAERAKLQLSQASRTKLSVSGGSRAVMVELTRQTFEMITRPLLDRTIEVVERVMRQVKLGGITPPEKILLVGGATLMPAVEEALQQRYGLECTRSDPHLAVARGAAILGAAIDEQRASGKTSLALPTVNRVLSRSFGVRLDRETRLDREDLYIHFIAYQNDRLPTGDRQLRVFTKAKSSTELSLALFEQATPEPSERLEDNREVSPPGGFTFTGLPNLPQGSPVDMTVSISAEGLASVHAVEPTTGKQLETQVTLGVLQQPDLAELALNIGRLTLNR